MQIRSHRFSLLRQQLVRLKDVPTHALSPFLDNSPLIRGTLYTLRRKCGKSSCRCARGKPHESLVLTASVSGKTRLWTIPQERSEEIRQRTQDYRRFRKARADFIRSHADRGAQILRTIDALEKIRTVEP